jgi:hypothetical protein
MLESFQVHLSFPGSVVLVKKMLKIVFDINTWKMVFHIVALSELQGPWCEEKNQSALC